MRTRRPLPSGGNWSSKPSGPERGTWPISRAVLPLPRISISSLSVQNVPSEQREIAFLGAALPIFVMRRKGSAHRTIAFRSASIPVRRLLLLLQISAESVAHVVGKFSSQRNGPAGNDRLRAARAGYGIIRSRERFSHATGGSDRSSPRKREFSSARLEGPRASNKSSAAGIRGGGPAHHAIQSALIKITEAIGVPAASRAAQNPDRARAAGEDQEKR